MEPISQMRGAAFRPAERVGLALGARHHSAHVGSTTYTHLLQTQTTRSRCRRCRLQVSWPQLLRVCSRRSSVTKEEAVMMMSVLITSPLPDRERRSCARCELRRNWLVKPVLWTRSSQIDHKMNALLHRSRCQRRRDGRGGHGRWSGLDVSHAPAHNTMLVSDNR